MVQVDYSGLSQLGGKCSLQCGKGFSLGAKIALDLPAANSAMSAAVYAKMPDLAASAEERFPPSPRRQLLRGLVDGRGQRQAVREQRALEIERELLQKLGLDADSASPASGSRSNVEPTTTPACKMDCQDGATSTSTYCSLDRPSSGRRGPLAGIAGSGPSRPPKPKPYRPLNLNEDSSATAASVITPVEALPDGRRWKSALTAYWPDRQGPPSDMGLSHQEAPKIEDLSPSCTALGQEVFQVLTPTHEVPAKIVAADVVNTADLRCNSDATQEIRPEQASVCAETTPHSPVLHSLKDISCEHHSARLQEELQLVSRTRQLEASAQRLRDNVQKLKFDNRRSRVVSGNAASRSAGVPSSSAAAAADSLERAAMAAVPDAAGHHFTTSAVSPDEVRRLEEMRQKIAELDKVNELEQRRLEAEQQEVQARRKQQEDFERGLQERTERELQQHRDREARAEAERAAREEELQRINAEREERRKEKLHQDEERSKRLEAQAKSGRSEEAQLRWARFEEELDRHWAAQEAEERRRVDLYAKERQQRFGDWDRRFASERQKFAGAANNVQASWRLRQAQNSADADDKFYNRGAGPPSSTSSSTAPPPRPSSNQPLPQPLTATVPAALSHEEAQVMKELSSLKGLPRETQKAKVKELLFRWHPDKNPTCAEKATRVFQFLQRQRELVLGL